MTFVFVGTGASPLDMEATITTPSGVTELCEIRDEPDNLFDVKFTPIESGTNIISLKQKGIHIAGIDLSLSKSFLKILCLSPVISFHHTREQLPCNVQFLHFHRPHSSLMHFHSIQAKTHFLHKSFPL